MKPMGKFLGHTPNGMGLALTTVLAELLDCLVAKEILERRDVAAILNNARTNLSPDTNIVSVTDAMDIVSKLTERFQENV